MRLYRLTIVHAGYPPYVPNWGRYPSGFALAGWCFTWVTKEFIREKKAIAEFWRDPT